ncbi:MAG: hypothetical protein Fur0032_08100 [Terrimicrobiaceae bacterium]
MAVVAWIGWEALSLHFGKQAEKYDLAELENMEAASIIYDRSGKQMGKIFIQNRHPVPLSEISPNIVNAVIAAEDNQFRKHNGVDWMGIMRAAITNYRKGRISQGASTVTQQLARNSFELKERTYQRKLVEMFLAMRIEKSLSKDDIMRLYLNRVYFGSGFYGVEAAARGYFGKSAKDLDLGQAAALAGLLKSPQALSPFNNPEASKNARNFVLRRMRELGLISSAQLKQEVELPLYVRKRTNPFKVSYAIDAVRQQAIAALGFDRAMNGGFQIHTTFDTAMQRAAEAAVRDTLAEVEAAPGYSHQTFEQYRQTVKPIEDEINRGNMKIRMPPPRYLQSAVLSLDSATGGVLAMVGGRDFKHSEYNRATQARRPLGTAFTPFVFAAAFEAGAFPGDIVEDACIDNRYVMVGGDTGILGEWGVERPDNEYEGPIPMREALARGKNAATVRVGLRTGLEKVREIAKASGLSSPMRNYANAFLGSSEMTLDELTLGFTAFGGGGLRPSNIYMIQRITDADGNTVYEADIRRVPAMSREAAYQTHSVLETALYKGTGAAAVEKYGLKDFPAAGKTGTAYNFTDTYFVGYNSSVTTGVWVGFDKPTRIYRGAFGKDLALPIWVKVMNAATGIFPAVKFLKPETLQEVEICRNSGLRATPRCRTKVFDPQTGQNVDVPTTYLELARQDQIPNVACDVHGGGIRDYARSYDEAEWPRAASAVDLTRIRPVAVNSPSLLGLTDVYGAVRPGSAGFDESIPVARAIAVNEAPAAQPPLTLPDDAPPVAPLTRDESPTGGEPDVRRAEAVTPLPNGTGGFDAPAMAAPTPEPIRF